MPDNDTRGNSWLIPPSEYIAKRPAPYAVAPPTSVYLVMSDGCRLAADIYLPQQDGPSDGQRWPTIFIQTPYYRRFAVDPSATGVEVSPNVAKYRDAFIPRGYAVVIIDVRGTGASFGTRDSFRSPKERDDAVEVVDWIVAQSWSNGSVGATGVSYLGAAGDFLASTGHKAVKAIAPLFSVWDTYLDNYYPGGILLNKLAAVYDRLMVGLDQDQRDVLRDFSYYADPALRGPQPVDADPDGELCRQAVAEHAGNFHMPEFMDTLAYRNEPTATGVSSSQISPSSYSGGVRPDVAVYSVSGWMDGAGYANGAISRFLTLPNTHKYLLLGPWDHGARINASPWRCGESPQFDLMAEIVRFFDEHLASLDTGLRQEQPVHYFTAHEECWHAAAAWPPFADHRQFYLAENGRLSQAIGTASSDSYPVNYAIGTGKYTRYERIAAIDSRQYYIDWTGRDRHMLNFSGAPLERDAEITGHVTLALWVASSTPDCAIHVYLSELTKDGETHYITEGLLRALHRHESSPPACYQTPAVFHPCTRAEAKPMPVGEPQLLRFSMLPVSWMAKAGSVIRLSIAGADSDHCETIPGDGGASLAIFNGRDYSSDITLPIRSTAATGQVQPTE